MYRINHKAKIADEKYKIFDLNSEIQMHYIFTFFKKKGTVNHHN